ncbi:hypothetical protein [Burkholderia gladioli]|uniref:hypothetical protein n=1 Tax=Burkholderia gladioli TaxID=28095 RepID=UPI001641C2DB|nr:hypothetical protein [Burkholderia gladioli]
MTIKTADGEEWPPSEFKLMGSVAKVGDRADAIHQPARTGEFPVFVEQSGDYRIFTYGRKLVSIDG